MTNETKLIKVSDSKHPITIDADATKVVARVGDITIADTSDWPGVRLAHRGQRERLT
jgi:uncharacterized protein (DUF427 family)